MSKPLVLESAPDPVDRYLAEMPAADETDAAVFARCDAVIALAAKIGESPDIGWAYAEARDLARAAPGSYSRPKPRPWYLNPALAWSAAGIFAVAFLATTLPRALTGLAVRGTATEDIAAAGTPIQAANITFAPIVVSPELAQLLAGIRPVVVLANETPVDARSLAVLPFAQTQNETRASPVAESIYTQVLRQLSAVPGIIVVDPATAAIYSGSGLQPEEIALQLGVRGIVEGRVESVDGGVRFELRLTDAAAAGASIDEAIERPSDQLAMLQTDITSSVLAALARTQPPIPWNPILEGDSQ